MLGTLASVLRPPCGPKGQGASEWAHIWTQSIHNIVFEGNYHDTAVIDNNGVNITMRDNVLVNDSFPPEAQAIMAAAGPHNSPWAHYFSDNQRI